MVPLDPIRMYHSRHTLTLILANILNRQYETLLRGSIIRFRVISNPSIPLDLSLYHDLLYHHLVHLDLPDYRLWVVDRLVRRVVIAALAAGL